MKELLFFLALGSLNGLHAQCGAPQSSVDLHGNNIQARILNGGDLFTDFNSGQFIPNPSSSASPTTIFAAGLWMGGVDLGGNLKVAAVNTRGFLGTDYSAGPLNGTGTTNAFNCANWDRMFRVTDSEIAAFKQAQPLSQAQAIAQFPGIMGWPANGNVAFASVWGFNLPSLSLEVLAPFYDANFDAIYSPLDGDYPAVQLAQKAPFVPAEIVWCVFNDQKGGAIHPVTKGAPLNMEIQLTAWAFNCPDEPELNNTVFTSHRLINRGTEAIQALSVGFWVDFDLGCYEDDYVGCSKSRNTMFAYNQDAVDGNIGNSCAGTPTFAGSPPVQTVTFLNSADFSQNDYALDKFISYGVFGNPATNDPVDDVEYYRNLTGFWRDGTTLTYGQVGYGGTTPTDLLFPGDPSDANGWSMCTSGQSFADRRVLGTQMVGLVNPGQVLELNTAWAVHNNVPQPCNLGNAMDEVDIIRAHHNNNYVGLCSAVSSNTSILPADNIQLFPNPTNSDATLRYGSIQVNELRIYDATGKLLQSLKNLGNGETVLKTNQLPTGMYSLRLFTDEGSIIKTLAVVR